ncbi:MAG: hypothetical protein HFE67_07680 [Erysipelotrichaceae bacterium]|nr:hypothetical protein [Erysipelotrichaceae bacterium]
MEKDEQLLACFTQEIQAIKEQTIASLKQELEANQARIEQELRNDAKAKADEWFAQEAAQLSVEHAIAMSQLGNDSQQRLLCMRKEWQDRLFDQLKQRMIAFRKEDQYVQLLKQKLRDYERETQELRLEVGEYDRDLLPQLLAVLGEQAQGVPVSDIAYGGFRLYMPQRRRLVDETFDSALAEAQEYFIQNSGLIIA